MGIREYAIGILLVCCLTCLWGWERASGKHAAEVSAHALTKISNEAAIAQSNALAATIANERNETSAEIARLTKAETDRQAADAAQSTNTRRGTIRHAIRQADAPADPALPVRVPDSVWAAVNQARADTVAAGSELRAGLYRRPATHPRRADAHDARRAAHMAGMGGLGKRVAGLMDAGTHLSQGRASVPGRAARRGRHPVSVTGIPVSVAFTHLPMDGQGYRPHTDVLLTP